MKNRIIKRKWTILALSLIVPFGFLSKIYTGPAHVWINNSLGGILYIIFWSFIFYFIFPNINPLKISTIVFIGTCLIEILQLWHPGFLELFHHSFIGRILLGTTFSMLDFFHYLVGWILSLILLKYLCNLETEHY